MKKKSVFAALAALFFVLSSILAWSQNTVQIEGKVTDGTKPIPNAQITLANVDNNRVVKLKADKNGSFAAPGIPFGNYNIDVTTATGEKIYSAQKHLQIPESGGAYQLMIDISKPPQGPQGQAPQGQGAKGGGGTISAGGQTYTKEQVEEMKQKNEKAQNVNALITQAQTAMNAKN